MKRVLALCTAALLAVLLLAGCSGKKKEYVVLDDTFADEQYVIGFRKGDIALRNEVQRILCEMKKDGKLAEITTKWFGKDTSTVPESFTPIETSDDSLQKIKDKGKFILGLDDSFPPMGFRDEDNNIVGYDIDLAREVCKRMDVELELQPIDWTSNVTELDGGKVDCLWNGFSYNTERDEKTCLSEPYMNNRQVVVVLKDSGISKVDDLKGKTLTLQAGSTAEEALDSRPEVKDGLKEVAKVDNNVLAMYDLGKKGGADAVLMDEVVARYYTGHQDQLANDAK